MKNRKKLLITGASGFTGKHACDHFSKQGYDIIAVTRSKITVNKKIQVEYCDLNNKQAVKDLIARTKPDYVLHLAGQNNVTQSWRNPILSLEANAMVTAYLMEAIRQENSICKVIIIGSALQFHPKDISTLQHPYSFSKTLQVMISQSYNILYDLNIVIAKPTNLIGPGYTNGVTSIFARKVVDMEINNAKKLLPIKKLGAQRDFIDVRDAVSAYEMLLTKGEAGEIYNVSSGKSRSLEELVELFKELTNVDFQIQTDESSSKEASVNIQPIKLKSLGWERAISLETSLKDILNFYRHNSELV